LISATREFVVGELGLLDAEHVDRVGGEPLQQVRQAHFQGVDVPGGNFHCSGVSKDRKLSILTVHEAYEKVFTKFLSELLTKSGIGWPALL
jgi:hypothetical protein